MHYSLSHDEYKMLLQRALDMSHSGADNDLVLTTLLDHDTVLAIRNSLKGHFYSPWSLAKFPTQQATKVPAWSRVCMCSRYKKHRSINCVPSQRTDTDGVLTSIEYHRAMVERNERRQWRGVSSTKHHYDTLDDAWHQIMADYKTDGDFRFVPGILRLNGETVTGNNGTSISLLTIIKDVLALKQAYADKARRLRRERDEVKAKALW